jgi:Tfp pilus assembly protein PilZ
MRKRPLSLIASALLFLYFPIELFLRWSESGGTVSAPDFVLSVVLPLILLIGLIRVSRVGWYTLVTMVALWGVRDLYAYYMTRGSSIAPLLVHLGIYGISMGYFINPRVRHLYFDPKLRWWRTRRRYETHLPFIMSHGQEWHYPILRDISEGGCFIETRHPLDINSKIQISIPLPEPINLSVIKAEGEVRWISRNPARFGMGVQFTEHTPQDARALKDFVRKHVWH